ncbi:MAG TPA: hydrogenase maturation protease [Gemmata sp.]|nr:hydrogenase maturation protease [Gemmata sp.]
MAESLLRIVGLGSDHGDDRAGWEAIRRLADGLPSWIQLAEAADPLAIVGEMPEADSLIVIDACRGAGLPGSIHRFEWPETSLPICGSLSTHGLGLAAALQIAEELGRLPSRVVVFAIEAVAEGSAAALSPAVEAAIPKLVARVLEEAAALAGREL